MMKIKSKVAVKMATPARRNRYSRAKVSLGLNENGWIKMGGFYAAPAVLKTLRFVNIWKNKRVM
jgi:hypothetical protein